MALILESTDYERGGTQRDRDDAADVRCGQGNREEARLIFKGKAAHHRDPNYLEELDTIARFRPSGRFLDVGCSMGDAAAPRAAPLDRRRRAGLRLLSARASRRDGIVYVKIPTGGWNLFKQRVPARRPLHRRAPASRSCNQIPGWHLYVGHDYQYPSPWTTRLERVLRFGAIGAFAPNVVAIGRRRGEV